MLDANALLINRHDYEGMPAGPPSYQVIEGELLSRHHPICLTRQLWAFLCAAASIPGKETIG